MKWNQVRVSSVNFDFVFWLRLQLTSDFVFSWFRLQLSSPAILISSFEISHLVPNRAIKSNWKVIGTSFLVYWSWDQHDNSRLWICYFQNDEILVVEGHEFYIKRTNKFTTACNFSKYQSYKCRVSAFSQDGQLIRVNGEHNHNASIGKQATGKIIKEIKALKENLNPAAAVASAILPITDVLSTQYALLSKPKLIQTSQRLRKNVQTESIHEPSDRHFDIPDTFQEFLQYDSGKDDHERILIFGDLYIPSILEASKFWLAERTFKLSHKNFYQIYTLHVYILGIAPACLYALLPNQNGKKRTADYLMP